MKLAKLSLISGLTATLIIFILSLFLNSGISQRVSGCIGLILIISTIITSGSLISGDRQRANDNTETTNDKKTKGQYLYSMFSCRYPYFTSLGIS